MSSKGIIKKANNDFVARLIEVCGSEQPADVARILKVSYQAAKNYLNGRLPDSSVLLSIAEKMPYSVHWLLTGEGDKFVAGNDLKQDTPLAPGALRAFVRRECRQIVSEILSVQTQPAEIGSDSRTVVLTPDKIREEKVADNADVFASKRR